MEGYFWRFSDPASGLVVVALCGICRDRAGSWANVALAAHPHGLLRERLVAPASADELSLRVRVGEVLEASEDGLSVDLGPDARLQVRLSERVPWPRRAFGALGPAHWIPALGQYWHPHLLGARARGEVCLDGERTTLDGAQVYAEKNWGSAFPRRWWWGQAQGFAREDVCVAFAGGELPGLRLHATAVVVRVGGELVRMSAPAARVHADADGSRWNVVGRSPRHAIELEGTALCDPFALPVPVPAERRCEPTARQQLAGSLWLRVRGPRVRFEGETSIAGLEYGERDHR